MPAPRPRPLHFLATSEAELAVLGDAQRVQHAEGLHQAVLIGPDEVARLQPHIRLDGVLGAAWCPTDGYIRPMGLLQGYLAAAGRGGATVIGSPRCARVASASRQAPW